MHYKSITLKKEFNINRIVTIHYYEFSKDFTFSGERHNFWEFLYVDEGQVEVAAEKNNFTLGQGEIIFHKPNELHSVWANRKTAPNAVVICFECNSPSMEFFHNKIFSLGDEERGILANIIKEAFNAFCSPLGDPEKNVLVRTEDQVFGCEQLIKAYLEILLITIVRNGKSLVFKRKLSSTVKEYNENDIVQRIIEFMKRNISTNLSLKELCHFFNVGRTYLTCIFKKRTGMGIIEYFRNLKVEQAKILIREGNYNFTEISEVLGYSSIHYFSRHFKQATGFAPTDYARSIKVRV
jgi:AraC-like DNA-binding protein